MKKIIITVSLLFSSCISDAQWYAEPFYNGIDYPSYESLIDQPDSILAHIGTYVFTNDMYIQLGREYDPSYATPLPIAFVMFDCDTAEYKGDVLKYLKLEKNEMPHEIPHRDRESKYAYTLTFFTTLLELKKYYQMNDKEKEQYEEMIDEKYRNGDFPKDFH